MQKRGQLTLFIVLGIVIVASILLAISFRGEIAEKLSDFELAKSEKVKQFEVELKLYADDCLKKVSIEGVERVMASGGYYNNAEKSVEYGGVEVSFYFYEGQENLPDKKQFAVSLAKYIQENVGVCIGAYYLDLSLGDVEAEVSVGKDVEVSVKQTLGAKIDETNFRVKSYSAGVDFDYDDVEGDLLEFYNLVNNISRVDFLSQGRLALEEKYEFYVYDFDDTESVFILKFLEVLEGKDADWRFAMKYPKTESKPIETDILKLFEVIVG